MSNCCKTKYCSGCGIPFYLATASVGTADVVYSICTKFCTVCRRGVFGVNIPVVGTGTLPVFLSFGCDDCCSTVGNQPLYNPTTGVQVTAAELLAGVTYLISYDHFSKRFYVQTPLVTA